MYSHVSYNHHPRNMIHPANQPEAYASIYTLTHQAASSSPIHHEHSYTLCLSSGFGLLNSLPELAEERGVHGRTLLVEPGHQIL